MLFLSTEFLKISALRKVELEEGSLVGFALRQVRLYNNMYRWDVPLDSDRQSQDIRRHTFRFYTPSSLLQAC